MKASGLTLIEVVIAVAVTSIAVLSAAGLQSTGFRANRAAQVNAQLSHLAASEMELQKVLEHTQTSTTYLSCLSPLPSSGMTCEVVIYPCELSGGALHCQDGSLGTPDAYQLDVFVTGYTQELHLKTVMLP